MVTHNKFNLFNDQDKQLCFVSLSSLSRQIAEEFKEYHASNIAVEDLPADDASWYEDKQFIVVTSDVSLKKKAVAYIEQNQGTFFSVIHKNSEISHKTHIGHGTFVYAYTQTLPNEVAVIGNHCCIGSHVVVGHNVIMHDHCHISPQCYISNCVLNEGVVVGVQSRIMGQFNSKISVASYCNIFMNSTVTKNIEKSATYYNNKLVNHFTSLDHRIL